MDEYKKKVLENAGIDLDEVNERFMGNNVFIDRIFIKFIEDSNFTNLKEAISNNDSKKAFIAAHTLKGICAELSIKSFGDITCKLSYLLKGGDIKSASAIMPEASHRYEVLSEALRTAFQ